METLIIDRKKWWRGKGGGELLNKSGKMCCLGFDLIRRGFTQKDILNKPRPMCVSEDVNRRIKGLTRKDGNAYGDTRICWRLADDNDETRIDEPERETRIRAGFKKIGIRVKFIN